MKQTVLLSLVLFWVGALSAQKPIYFNIITHNEITDPLKYESSKSDFESILPIVKEICDTIIAKKAKYNMQVESNFIKGVLRFQNAADNPNDILEWANNSEYIDVDGHNHFSPMSNPYNYSDLAYLLDSCGVNLEHRILGGVAYANIKVGNRMVIENWTQYAKPKQGYTFKDFFWQADIVWGTAAASHAADLTYFGVWKPKGGKSVDEFLTHDPDQTITHIGGGCKQEVSYHLDVRTHKLTMTTQQIIDNIKQISDNIQSLPSDSNEFYTMNMLLNFRDFTSIPHLADSIAHIIDGIKPLVEEGKLIWSTLGEKYDRWYALHQDPKSYFGKDCQDIFVLGTEAGVQDRGIKIYPNPFYSSFTISNSTAVMAEVRDLMGNLVLEEEINGDTRLNLLEYPRGMYFVILKSQTGNRVWTGKLLKQ